MRLIFKNNKKMITIILLGNGVLIFLFVILLIISYINSNCKINISNSNLVKTKTGYKEILIINSEVCGKTKKWHIPPGKTMSHLHYFILYYNKDMGEIMGVKVSKNKYENYFKIGDKVTVTRNVYYDNNGYRLCYKDTITKIN